MWRSILVVSLFGLATCARAQLVGISQECRPETKGTLSICAGMAVPVIFLSTATSEDQAAPVLVVATDIRVDNHVVIAQGSIVHTTVYGQPAHIFHFNDAVVDVQLLSVSTVTGDIVALGGSVQQTEERIFNCEWADGEPCIPGFLPVRAKIKVGTLVTASVQETVQLRTELVEQLTHERVTRSQDEPTVYVYTRQRWTTGLEFK